MRIRRYLGYDCDSVNGFNNGRYIDNEPIECADYTQAEALCADALEEYSGMPKGTFEDMGSDMPCLQLITTYFNEHGECTLQEYENTDDPNVNKTGYRYVYISAETED